MFALPYSYMCMKWQIVMKILFRTSVVGFFCNFTNCCGIICRFVLCEGWGGLFFSPLVLTKCEISIFFSFTFFCCWHFWLGPIFYVTINLADVNLLLNQMILLNYRKSHAIGNRGVVKCWTWQQRFDDMTDEWSQRTNARMGKWCEKKQRRKNGNILTG